MDVCTSTCIGKSTNNRLLYSIVSEIARQYQRCTWSLGDGIYPWLIEHIAQELVICLRWANLATWLAYWCKVPKYFLPKDNWSNQRKSWRQQLLFIVNEHDGVAVMDLVSIYSVKHIGDYFRWFLNIGS